eukprot:augustus_masked-scaffold_51-processed-gene-1.85-mRNA-1 protein AED:1.00 eAED:1.00 QI:0/-1/0/0/-1/1/1/0/558
METQQQILRSINGLEDFIADNFNANKYTTEFLKTSDSFNIRKKQNQLNTLKKNIDNALNQLLLDTREGVINPIAELHEHLERVQSFSHVETIPQLTDLNVDALVFKETSVNFPKNPTKESYEEKIMEKYILQNNIYEATEYFMDHAEILSLDVRQDLITVLQLNLKHELQILTNQNKFALSLTRGHPLLLLQELDEHEGIKDDFIETYNFYFSRGLQKNLNNRKSIEELLENINTFMEFCSNNSMVINAEKILESFFNDLVSHFTKQLNNNSSGALKLSLNKEFDWTYFLSMITPEEKFKWVPKKEKQKLLELKKTLIDYEFQGIISRLSGFFAFETKEFKVIIRNDEMCLTKSAEMLIQEIAKLEDKLDKRLELTGNIQETKELYCNILLNKYFCGKVNNINSILINLNEGKLLSQCVDVEGLNKDTQKAIMLAKEMSSSFDKLLLLFNLVSNLEYLELGINMVVEKFSTLLSVEILFNDLIKGEEVSQSGYIVMSEKFSRIVSSIPETIKKRTLSEIFEKVVQKTFNYLQQRFPEEIFTDHFNFVCDDLNELFRLK